MLENEKVEAQQALDELFNEHLLPFELSARQLEPTGEEECQVRFHDSRLFSVDVSWFRARGFKAAFRAAVVERVKRLSGPLYRKKSKT